MSNLPSSFFDLVAGSRVPVLVDFYADWCQPCKMVSPAIARIAREYKGEILTVKIDVDKKQRVASVYGITSIPTIMMFDNGKEVMRLQGAMPYEAMKREIDARMTALKSRG